MKNVREWHAKAPTDGQLAAALRELGGGVMLGLSTREVFGQAWEVEDAVRLLNSRKYPLEKLITHRFPLERTEDAMKFSLTSLGTVSGWRWRLKTACQGRG